MPFSLLFSNILDVDLAKLDARIVKLLAMERLHELFLRKQNAEEEESKATENVPGKVSPQDSIALEQQKCTYIVHFYDKLLGRSFD